MSSCVKKKNNRTERPTKHDVYGLLFVQTPAQKADDTFNVVGQVLSYVGVVRLHITLLIVSPL